MPELSFHEWLSSGHSSIDRGIDGLIVMPTASGAVLFSTSGPRGGVASYALTSGPATLADFSHFERFWASDALPEIRVLSPAGTPLIAVAAGGETGLWTYAPDADGQLGTATLLSELGAETGPATDLAHDATGRVYLADALTGGFHAFDWTGSGYAPAETVTDAPVVYAEDIVRLLSIDRDGQRYVVTASQSENGVSAFSDTETGLAATGRLGADDGLGVMVPTDMASAQVGDRHFIILGSSAPSGEGGAISVMELRESGALLPVDHVTDTLATRFDALLALDVIDAGGRTYVVAGGADDGITLFVLLPDGRLHLLDAMAGGAGFSPGTVTALTGWWDGAALRVFATTEADSGIAAFTAPLTGEGVTLSAPDTGGTTTGGADDDMIAGGFGNDVIHGLEGDDIIADGAGLDTLFGGLGADRFILSADGVEDEIADFEPGQDRLDLSTWPMLLDPAQIAVETTLTGARIAWGDETLTLTRAGGGPISEAEILSAIIDAPQRQPFLHLIGGPGDMLEGGAPDEALEGGPGMDRLFGREGNDLLSGAGSEDMLFGGPGDDTLAGGTGADALDGGPGRDGASYVASPEGVFVRLWAGDGQGGDAEGDTLAGIEDLTGSPHADTLVGDGDDNRLDGGEGDDALWGNAGDDFLQGGSGADTLHGQDGMDTASYEGSAAGVTVRLWAGDGAGGDAEGDRLFGIEALIGSDHADTLVGDTVGNTLRGGQGDDALWGNAGDDTLEGGAGADLLQGQDGADWASYTTSEAAVFVRLWAGDGAGGHAEGDTLRGIENLRGSDHDDRLVGDVGANRITGGAGDDDIWANAGDDTLEGGAGSDTLRGQDGSDTASYAGSSAGVTVRLWAGDGWGGHATGDRLVDIENAEGSVHDDILSGSGAANILSGLAGNDEIWAGEGHDTLMGGEGSDVLRGQGGDDLLIGAAGADVFVFADGEGVDTVSDFSDGDRIDLRAVSAITSFEDLQSGAGTDSPEGVRIDTGGGEILIAGLSLANLDLTDFLF
jgi:Ca2+-binding RTX toxin-like protein